MISCSECGSTYNDNGRLLHFANCTKMDKPTRSMYEDVLEFSEKFNCWIGQGVGLPTGNVQQLRVRLIEEEVGETIKAIKEGNLIEIADGIADSIVVLIGTAIAYGIPLQDVWDEVHRSNMAKLQPDGTVKVDAGGKVIKPEGWTPPNIEEVLYGKK